MRLARLTVALAALMAIGTGWGMAARVVTPEQCALGDASKCIQAAIDEAAGRKTDVIIAPGLYTLRLPVRLATGVSILGTTETVLQPSLENREGTLLLSGVNVGDIRIEGITLEGGGKDFPIDSALVVLDGTHNVVLDSVTIQHARGAAVAFYSDQGVPSAENGIQNSRIFDVGNHWRTTGHWRDRRMVVVFWDAAPLQSHGNFARNNSFENTGLDAIQVAGQQGFVGEGNYFALATEERDVLDAGDYPGAFFIETSSDVIIRNNTIHDAPGNCIDMPGVTGALVEGNLITGCGQAAIGIFRDYDFDRVDSSHIVVRNNVILNGAIWADSCWKAGIVIANGSPTDIEITDNIITDMRPKGKKTQDYGIEVVNGTHCNAVTHVKGLKLSGNRLDGNQRAATHGIK